MKIKQVYPKRTFRKGGDLKCWPLFSWQCRCNNCGKVFEVLRKRLEVGSYIFESPCCPSHQAGMVSQRGYYFFSNQEQIDNTEWYKRSRNDETPMAKLGVQPVPDDNRIFNRPSNTRPISEFFKA